MASAAETIASGAQEQAASLEETSASLEEITAAVRQSADNANQASQLAAGSKDSALQGQDVVSNAITAMICWRSTRLWKRRGQAMKAAALP